jgi:hypothetical protein
MRQGESAYSDIVAEIADPMNCFISIQGYQLLLKESKPGLGREMRNKAL